MADLKKPKPSFVVRMVGSGLKPSGVDLRKFTRAMDAVQRLIEQRDDFQEGEDGESPSDAAPLQLLSVVTGSAVYRLLADDPQRAVGILRRTGVDIDAPKSVEWSSATLSSLRDLSDVARTLGCRIELRDLTEEGKRLKLGDVLASIGPDTYPRISSFAFMSGETSVFGKIERVGGATNMHCGLRIPHQHRMIICKVSNAELTRELGRYMYQHVTVHGTATWVRRGSFLKSMLIKSYDKPKRGSFTKTLDAVHRASHGVWDDVEDPEAAIAEMRAR